MWYQGQWEALRTNYSGRGQFFSLQIVQIQWKTMKRIPMKSLSNMSHIPRALWQTKDVLFTVKRIQRLTLQELKKIIIKKDPNIWDSGWSWPLDGSVKSWCRGRSAIIISAIWYFRCFNSVCLKTCFLNQSWGLSAFSNAYMRHLNMGTVKLKYATTPTTKYFCYTLI